MRHERILHLLLVVLALAAAGCSGDPTENPAPTSESSTTTSSAASTTSTTTPSAGYPDIEANETVSDEPLRLPDFDVAEAIERLGIPTLHRPAVLALYVDDRLCGAYYGDSHGTVADWNDATYQCLRPSDGHALVVEFFVGENVDGQPAAATAVVSRFSADGGVVQHQADFERAHDRVPAEWTTRTCRYDEGAVEHTSQLPWSTCGEWDAVTLSIPVADVAVRPVEPFTLDLPTGAAAPGDALFVVEEGPTSEPAWMFVGTATEIGGRLVAAALVPEVMWRLERGEFGLAELEQSQAGRYEIVTTGRERVATIDLLSDGDPTSFLEDEPLPVDEAFAILRADGLGDVAFGTPTEAAIAALIDRFGSPAVDGDVDGCLTLRVLAWDNGIYARFDDSFASYSFYGYDDPAHSTGEHDVDLSGADRPSFTTPTGIGLGSTMENLFLRTDFSGGYDARWGATIWIEGGTLGGALSGDVSAPGTFVTTVEAGRETAPAWTVC